MGERESGKERESSRDRERAGRRELERAGGIWRHIGRGQDRKRERAAEGDSERECSGRERKQERE